MSSNTIQVLARACALFLLSFLCACSFSYSAKPITARVVDAQTKEPIEGVIVVADWQLEGGLEGGYPQGELMVLETVTDQSGTFHFDGWGPKKIPPGRASNARLKNLDPGLLLFKSGYRYQGLQNEKSLDQVAGKAPALRSSDYDGKTIEMQKFTGTLEEYNQDLSQIHVELISFEGGCAWRGIPRMLKALAEQSKQFDDAHIAYLNSRSDNAGEFNRRLLVNEAFQARDGCGSVKAFFQEHSIWIPGWVP